MSKHHVFNDCDTCIWCNADIQESGEPCNDAGRDYWMLVKERQLHLLIDSLRAVVDNITNERKENEQ